jgi:3-oxoacyl-(acyl-carrier-protein) synthase
MLTNEFKFNKSMTGHLLGAAGAVETISSILSEIRNSSSNNKSFYR